mmetsp:Transcript_31083/g.99259  ORF Transcript_31083/g.99259 Transcript_31083/m.99259 type:complete len:204 (+) Transcript_31083:953-1564(+)
MNMATSGGVSASLLRTSFCSLRDGSTSGSASLSPMDDSPVLSPSMRPPALAVRPPASAMTSTSRPAEAARAWISRVTSAAWRSPDTSPVLISTRVGGRGGVLEGASSPASPLAACSPPRRPPEPDGAARAGRATGSAAPKARRGTRPEPPGRPGATGPPRPLGVLAIGGLAHARGVGATADARAGDVGNAHNIPTTTRQREVI